MKINQFALERYFARYEFSAKYLLSCSDCEPLYMTELLEHADSKTQDLWNDLKLSYTESAGHPLLRAEIADMYAGLNADDVIVAAPEEAIFLFMQALLNPGDHVICTYPGYQSLYEVARSIGCEISEWEPDENAGWHFSLDQFEKLIRPSTKLITVNFPHNPTGVVPSENEFKAIVDLARENGIYLLSDEMYRFLELGKVKTLPSACTLYDKAFSLSGMSKSFGLPGIRIGWMISQNKEILRQMAQLKDYTTICSSAPSEILAIAALQNKSKIIEDQIQRLEKNIKILDAFIGRRRNIFNLNKPLGGTVCFPRMLNVPSTEAFCKQLIEDSGIMLVPSKVFNYDDHHIRIGFGRDNFKKVIERFSDYLDKRSERE